MLFKTEVNKILGSKSEPSLKMMELESSIQAKSLGETAETLKAFSRYAELTADDICIIGCINTSIHLEILCQGHMGERYVLYASLVDGELLVENESYQDCLDYAEEMELTEEDINYIRFGKRKL